MTEVAQSTDGLEEIGRGLLEKINAEWQKKKTSVANLETSREPAAAVTREFIVGALKLFFGRYEDLMGVFSQNMYNLFDRRLIEIQEGQALGKDMLSLLALYVGQQQNECLLCDAKEKHTEYNALNSEEKFRHLQDHLKQKGSGTIPDISDEDLNAMDFGEPPSEGALRSLEEKRRLYQTILTFLRNDLRSQCQHCNERFDRDIELTLAHQALFLDHQEYSELANTHRWYCPRNNLRGSHGYPESLKQLNRDPAASKSAQLLQLLPPEEGFARLRRAIAAAIVGEPFVVKRTRTENLEVYAATAREPRSTIGQRAWDTIEEVLLTGPASIQNLPARSRLPDLALPDHVDQTLILFLVDKAENCTDEDIRSAAADTTAPAPTKVIPTLPRFNRTDMSLEWNKDIADGDSIKDPKARFIGDFRHLVEWYFPVTNPLDDGDKYPHIQDDGLPLLPKPYITKHYLFLFSCDRRGDLVMNTLENLFRYLQVWGITLQSSWAEKAAAKKGDPPIRTHSWRVDAEYKYNQMEHTAETLGVQNFKVYSAYNCIKYLRCVGFANEADLLFQHFWGMFGAEDSEYKKGSDVFSKFITDNFAQDLGPGDDQWCNGVKPPRSEREAPRTQIQILVDVYSKKQELWKVDEIEAKLNGCCPGRENTDLAKVLRDGKTTEPPPLPQGDTVITVSLARRPKRKRKRNPEIPPVPLPRLSSGKPTAAEPGRAEDADDEEDEHTNYDEAAFSMDIDQYDIAQSEGEEHDNGNEASGDPMVIESGEEPEPVSRTRSSTRGTKRKFQGADSSDENATARAISVEQTPEHHRYSLQLPGLPEEDEYDEFPDDSTRVESSSPISRYGDTFAPLPLNAQVSSAELEKNLEKLQEIKELAARRPRNQPEGFEELHDLYKRKIGRY